MKVILGFGIMLFSACLAIYNVTRNERKEITFPTVLLILFTYFGIALWLDLSLSNFKSVESTNTLDEKVAQVNEAKRDAITAQRLAEQALEQSRVVYAVSLARTGMLFSESIANKDLKEAKEILKEIYKLDYAHKVKSMIEQQILPKNFEP